jgi:hypothetical protein
MSDDEIKKLIPQISYGTPGNEKTVPIGQERIDEFRLEKTTYTSSYGTLPIVPGEDDTKPYINIPGLPGYDPNSPTVYPPVNVPKGLADAVPGSSCS